MPAKTVLALAFAATTAAGMSGGAVAAFADDAVRAPGAVQATETASPMPSSPESPGASPSAGPSESFTAPDVTAEQAISKAMEKQQDSTIASAKLESEAGTETWQVETLTKDDKWHQVTVDATTGEVTEDKESSESKQSTAVKDAKIKATDAIAKATEQQPGTVKELEFKEKDSKGSWTVEVVDDQGMTHEVKVDAETGEATMQPAETPTMSPTESPATSPTP
ncbi:PepSY domain-containing protein [Actinocorallia herbida]|nr:PepSY domain-containing protein [Actinocorallia herbida]